MEEFVQKYLLRANSVPGTTLATRTTAKNTVSGPVRELPSRGVRRKAEWVHQWVDG